MRAVVTRPIISEYSPPPGRPPVLLRSQSAGMYLCPRITFLIDIKLRGAALCELECVGLAYDRRAHTHLCMDVYVCVCVIIFGQDSHATQAGGEYCNLSAHVVGIFIVIGGCRNFAPARRCSRVQTLALVCGYRFRFSRT